MANILNSIDLGLMSLKNFESKALAYDVFSAIEDAGPQFFPTVYDVYEPLHHKCNKNDVDELDSFDDGIAKGRLYFYFKEDAISFLSLDQLLFAMEDVMDQVGTPQAWMKKRSFSKGKNDSGKGEPIQNRNPFYDFQAICPQKGHIASFYVRIYSRMNSSVQGGVKFEGNSENVAFRSELEFLHLIREGLSLATK